MSKTTETKLVDADQQSLLIEQIAATDCDFRAHNKMVADAVAKGLLSKDKLDLFLPLDYDEEEDYEYAYKRGSFMVTEEDKEAPSIIKTNEPVEYKFYGFEQGSEFTLKQLGYQEDKLVEVTTVDWLYSIVAKEDKEKLDKQLGVFVDGFELSISAETNLGTLYMGVKKGAVVYLLIKDSKLVTGFYDSSSSYQEGDSETKVYLYKGDSLVVDNIGDVSSVVYIKPTPEKKV